MPIVSAGFMVTVMLGLTDVFVESTDNGVLAILGAQSVRNGSVVVWARRVDALNNGSTQSNIFQESLITIPYRLVSFRGFHP